MLRKSHRRLRISILVTGSEGYRRDLPDARRVGAEYLAGSTPYYERDSEVQFRRCLFLHVGNNAHTIRHERVEKKGCPPRE